jgi:hypothetical protein
MASASPKTVCALCCEEIDETKHCTSLIWCSDKRCDQGVAYHASCGRDLQLSKKSEYPKRLNAVRMVATETKELTHCSYESAPVPVQCMHGIEEHHSCPVGAYTGCKGRIVKSEYLHKMAPPKSSPQKPSPPKQAAKHIATPARKPAAAPPRIMEQEEEAPAAPQGLSLSAFIPADIGRGSSGGGGGGGGSPSTRVDSPPPRVPNAWTVPSAGGAWASGAQSIKAAAQSMVEEPRASALVATPVPVTVPAPAVWPTVIDNDAAYEPKGFASMVKPVPFVAVPKETQALSESDIREAVRAEMNAAICAAEAGKKKAEEEAARLEAAMVAKEHLYEQRAAEIIALEQRAVAAEAAQQCAEEKAAQLQEELGMKAQESALAQMLSFKAEQQENDLRMADITNEKQATIDKRAAEAIAKLTEKFALLAGKEAELKLQLAELRGKYEAEHRINASILSQMRWQTQLQMQAHAGGSATMYVPVSLEEWRRNAAITYA